MAWTEKAFGDAIGKLYYAQYFDEACIVKCLSIIETGKEFDWMKSTTTREWALKKMADFQVELGYPDQWIDYLSLKYA